MVERWPTAAGGQHARRLAEELGLASVLLHPMAGVLSAYGMGQARQRRRRQRHLGEPMTQQLLGVFRAWLHICSVRSIKSFCTRRCAKAEQFLSGAGSALSFAIPHQTKA